jgi:flavorubredoxin
VQTLTHEIADGIFRFSTWIDDGGEGFTFNQYLVVAEEPLIFHTGPRALFPLVSAAVERVVPLSRLRWITFGHVEADECGSMNQWLAAAPRAEVAHGSIAVMVSLNDLADRPPRALADDEVLDLGGKRVRYVATPHVPHGWDAGLLHEELTGTLFCGDLFTRVGKLAVRSDDLLGPAKAAEDLFRGTCLTPATGPTIRRLAALSPRQLAPMHAPAYEGAAAASLEALADYYDDLLRREIEGRGP